jgi:hypothetical protein
MYTIFVLFEFNDCISLFLINVQETFVNLIEVFKLKNYFNTLFKFTMSYSIRKYYIFVFKYPLHTVALQKIIILTNFLRISIHFRPSGDLK